MRYSYSEGIEKQKSRKWLLFPIVGLLGGAYLLVNVFSPALLYVVQPPDETAKKLVSMQPELADNRVYIPKINTDVAIVPIAKNEAIALEKGAVQRSPGSGNPKDGGNFVLAAHRFNLGYTPSLTKAQSPFYHIDMLNRGDDIYIDYKGERYAYKVEERKLVPPTAVEIESRTDDNRLTMYSCELAGPKAGREVIVAQPVGKVVWTNGKPKLRSL